MPILNEQDWLPTHILNHNNEERRVGIEIELAGVTPEQLTNSVIRHFGGKCARHSSFEFTLENTRLGKFKIELDAAYLKTLGAYLEQSPNIQDENSLEGIATDIITKAAEQFIPWELITPPIAIKQLSEIKKLIATLRDEGALGTRNSLRYAFGLHLNPELPNLETDTIVRYFRAYLCLYDWLADHDQIDLSRKLSSYISHFNKDYIQQVVYTNYQPTLAQLIDDYIEANPSRNRSLDLLPLFTYLDEKRVRKHLKDPRIKGRPTFHYRMPNCDIDNPDWNLDHPWQAWLQVEALANNPQKLHQVCKQYAEYLDTLLATYDNEWLHQTHLWLNAENSNHAG